MENELKRARKRSFTLEGMLLNRANGIYNTRKQSEMGDEYDDDSLELTTKINAMTDYSFDHMGRTCEITNESRDHMNTSHMTNKSRVHTTNRARKKAVHSLMGRTTQTGTSNPIRDNEPHNSTETINLSERSMTDNPSEIPNKVPDQRKNNLNISLEKKNKSLNFDINNNSETRIEGYENRTCLGNHERNLAKDELIHETSSSVEDLSDELFYPLDGKRDITIGRVTSTRRRSSV